MSDGGQVRSVAVLRIGAGGGVIGKGRALVSLVAGECACGRRAIGAKYQRPGFRLVGW